MEDQAVLYPHQVKTFLSAHFLSVADSSPTFLFLCAPSFAFCGFISKGEVLPLRVELCYQSWVVSVTKSDDECSAIAGVCDSLSVDYCLMILHQVSRVSRVRFWEANGCGPLVKSLFD